MNSLQVKELFPEGKEHVKAATARAYQARDKCLEYLAATKSQRGARSA
jgi:hypothetical protein